MDRTVVIKNFIRYKVDLSETVNDYTVVETYTRFIICYN